MIITNTGSFFLFTPETTEERVWIDDNVAPEGWQWMGNSLAVDARFAEGLAVGMTEDGITIS